MWDYSTGKTLRIKVQAMTVRFDMALMACLPINICFLSLKCAKGQKAVSCNMDPHERILKLLANVCEKCVVCAQHNKGRRQQMPISARPAPSQAFELSNGFHSYCICASITQQSSEQSGD